METILFFIEDKKLHKDWSKSLQNIGLPVRIGRWDIPGQPLTVLVNFQSLFAQKDEIYGRAWELFQVDSLHAYGDYDEASMFSYAAGKVAEVIVQQSLWVKR